MVIRITVFTKFTFSCEKESASLQGVGTHGMWGEISSPPDQILEELGPHWKELWAQRICIWDSALLSSVESRSNDLAPLRYKIHW